MFGLSEYLIQELEIGLAEVVAVVACFFLLRSAWRQIPHWAKPAWLRRWQGDDLSADDGDLDSPFVIAGKLQEMMQIAKTRCDAETPANLSFRGFLSSFLAIVKLWQELRELHPHFREEQYHDYEANRPDGVPGRPVDAAQDDLKNLYGFMEFSDWAYLEDYNELRRRLKEKNFDLLRQDLATQPGRVGHYIALDYTRKMALIGIKGTSHVSDIFTDLVANALPHSLQSPFAPDGTEVVVRVHEGIWTAATTLADDIQEFLEQVLIPAGYQILLCGHSLGAGTSCLLGLILRSRMPVLQEKLTTGDGQHRLRVVAFATPAVLNFDACVACAPFCTCVINNSDIVARASVSNLVIMNRLMVEVQGKVKGKYSDHIYKIAKNTKAFYRNMTDLMKTDNETIMSADEWDKFFDETHRTTKEINNLYVPGKVICLYEKGSDDPEKKIVEYGGVVGDGGMKMLRQVEVTPTMVSDHSCSSYYFAIATFARVEEPQLTTEKGDESKKDD